jgi:N-acetylmuramoyl-L-alanine amidase
MGRVPGLLLLAALFLSAAMHASGAESGRGMAACETLAADEVGARDPARWRTLALSLEKSSQDMKGADFVESLYAAAFARERAFRFSMLSKDFEESVRIYGKVADIPGESEYADDALFRLGLLHEGRGDTASAKVAWERLIRQVPGGDMVEAAKRRIAETGKSTLVRSVRTFSAPAYTRVVVDLTTPTGYEIGALPPDPQLDKPARIFLDILRAKIGKDCDDCLPVADGLVTQVRAGQNAADRVRVVLDLDGTARFSAFPLIEPARLVVDVFRTESADPTDADLVADLIAHMGDNGAPRNTVDKTVRPANEPPAGRGGKRSPPQMETAPPGGLERETPPPLPLPSSKDGRGSAKPAVRLTASGKAAKELRIVIDPGHGGQDPGAIGVNGLQEKDVTLAVAKELRRQLKGRIPCRILLTREDDRTLSLSQRTAAANAFDADLFVSIHANAARNRSARGIETYYLDRASDRSARRVAAQENQTTEDRVAETEHILADVLLGLKLPESRRLARTIQEAIVAKVAGEFGAVRDLGVKRAPFYVLTGAVMPSVLVETAFLSNAEDAKWLKSETYRGKVAEAMADAVETFVRDI